MKSLLLVLYALCVEHLIFFCLGDTLTKTSAPISSWKCITASSNSQYLAAGSSIGGVEGFITRYDRQCERIEYLREKAEEKKIVKEKCIVTSNKRKKQLATTRALLSDAEVEAMRGLKTAKLQVKKIKMGIFHVILKVFEL